MTRQQRKDTARGYFREARAARELTAVACDVMGIKFGPAEKWPGAVTEDVLAETQSVNGVLQDRMVPVVWVMTDNKDTLIYQGA